MRDCIHDAVSKSTDDNKTDNASIRIRNIVSLVHFQTILKLARESSVNRAEPYICVLFDDVIYGQLLVSLR